MSDSRITSITHHKKVLRKLNHVPMSSNDSYTENKIVHPLLRSLFRVIPKRVSIPEVSLLFIIESKSFDALF